MQILSRQEARSQEQRTYFTGKPCRLGHISERYTGNAGCVVCAKARADEWVKRNSDKKKKASSSWEKRNPDKRKAWRDANLDKVKGYNAKANAIAKANGKLSTSKRRWKQANQGLVKAHTSKRRATKLNATLTGQDEALKQIYFTCPKGMEVDHVIPLVHPLVCGLHVPWNLQYLTPEANRQKSNRFQPYHISH